MTSSYPDRPDQRRPPAPPPPTVTPALTPRSARPLGQAVEEVRARTARPTPDGWFAVASSAEVRPGRVVTRRLAGQDVVLYRTASGRLRAVRPFCPHLGAHLGHGGRVHGENLVCPFHHFEFDPEGTCVATGYGTPPPRARLGTLEHREIAGLVFVWRHGRGEGPSWEIKAPPMEGFRPPHCTVRTVVAHPQDFMENVVDTGHFTYVHKIVAETVDGPHFDGPRIEALYRLGRTTDGTSGLLASSVTMRMMMQGLGVFHSEVRIPRWGLELRGLFCAVPLDQTHMDYRLAVTVRFPHLRHRGAADALARSLAGPMAWLNAFDTRRDEAIWANSAYLKHPRLAPGDGPILKFRRWARQFYTENPAQPTTSPTEGHDG
ncbi:aromatic ring-hydroxylating dioxygenase subunit alpha [Streptomyces sp. NPDC057702]|uniref:aromatic ring-hydroxylating oxygenase subunit alpha n=1 Tax=unclassified Streptomyces TaxID=2593676 RepID=UPI003695F886